MSEKDDDVMVIIEDNNQSPKITSDLVNVPITPLSQGNKLLTYYEFSDKRNSECQTENGENKDNLNDVEGMSVCRGCIINEKFTK